MDLRERTERMGRVTRSRVVAATVLVVASVCLASARVERQQAMALRVASAAGAQLAAPGHATLPDRASLDELRGYIRRTWATLTRTPADLHLAAHDPKLPKPPGQPYPVYVAPASALVEVSRLVDATLPADARKTVALRSLPARHRDISEHGLLYLPRPYVVPGGRFNEMYGWDSYFIQLGLLRDGEVALARDLVDNFVYEVEHYGTILNANRSYYLTRSQPPFLTRMILGVFERTRDQAWLARVWPAVERHYDYWVQEPHLLPATGLSRYFDLGDGPAPEVLADEKDAAGRTHYDRVRAYFATREVTDYDLALYYDRKRDRLTPLFYKGDRSMRESGFDPSNRFGPFSVDIVHHAAVCLNSLLYQMERDASEIVRLLGRPAEVPRWEDRARRRRERINTLLWDDRAGLYFDYNVRVKQRRAYPFATTFYPLWAGVATPEQARRVRDQLPMFEREGGLLTSTTVTGNQWDAPFGWAPLQLIAAEGLRRYGYDSDADRLSARFIGLVTKEFREHGTIVEKYDVVRRESDVAADVTFGYSGNQIGFGWTNGVVLELLARMRQPATP